MLNERSEIMLIADYKVLYICTKYPVSYPCVFNQNTQIRKTTHCFSPHHYLTAVCKFGGPKCQLEEINNQSAALVALTLLGLSNPVPPWLPPGLLHQPPQGHCWGLRGVSRAEYSALWQIKSGMIYLCNLWPKAKNILKLKEVFCHLFFIPNQAAMNYYLLT